MLFGGGASLSIDNVFGSPLRGTARPFQATFVLVVALTIVGGVALVLRYPAPGPVAVFTSPGFLVLAGLVALADLYPLVPWLGDVRNQPVFMWSAALSLAALLAYGPWAVVLFPLSGLMANLRRNGNRWWRTGLNSAMFGLQGLVAGLALMVLDASGESMSTWRLLWLGVLLALVVQVANGVLLGVASVTLGIATVRSEVRTFLSSVGVWGTSLLFAPLLAELAMVAPALLPLLAVALLGLHQTQGALNRSTRQARTDPLTGLANRAALLDRLTRLLDGAAGPSAVTVLMMDLDGFKAVNDTYGHPVGDDVLVTVARRLAGAVDASALVARYGGDEFAVVLGAEQSEADNALLVDRLTAAVSGPVAVGREEVCISASIGVATVSDARITPMELIARADRAMYRSKSLQLPAGRSIRPPSRHRIPAATKNPVTPVDTDNTGDGGVHLSTESVLER